jgi:hypothetical protein
MLHKAVSGCVPARLPHDILVLPMKSLSLIFACGLLAACAGPDYRQVEPAGGGTYLLAQSPPVPRHVHYPADHHGALLVYGLQPWWSYTYYSPNFYPHYFSFWYPSWPGYYPGMHSSWHGDHRFGYRPDHFRPISNLPGTMPAEPEPAEPPRVVAPTDPQQRRWGMTDGENVYRHPGMVRYRSIAFPPRSASPAVATQPTVRSIMSPSPSSPVLGLSPAVASPGASSPPRSIERSHRSADHTPRHHDR